MNSNSFFNKDINWWKSKYIYVFVGGPISNIGKGVITSVYAYQLIIKNNILIKDVNILKIDPYYNIDNYQMYPAEHGEVFVGEDGSHMDLDLGYYQRFLGITPSRSNCLTGGMIIQEFNNILNKDNIYTITNNDLTSIMINKIINLLENHTYLICELGGTVGESEQDIYLEAFRLIQSFIYNNIEINYVSALFPVNNMFSIKTKLIQNSLKCIINKGIHITNMMIKISNHFIKQNIETNNHIKKINQIFPGAKVFLIPEVKNIYTLTYKVSLMPPYLISDQNLPTYQKTLKIGLIGKYLYHDESYKSIIDQLHLWNLNEKYNLLLINIFYNENNVYEECDLYIILPGFGKKLLEEQIQIIKYLRQNKKHVLGICLGYQLMIIEYVRYVLNNQKIGSREMGIESNINIIDYITNSKSFSGAKTLHLDKNLTYINNKIYGYDKFHEIYKNQYIIHEIFRHKFGVTLHNLSHEDNDKLDNANISWNCFDLTSDIAYGIPNSFEITNLSLYIGVQFHPEYKNNNSLKCHAIFNYVLNFISKK